MSLTFTENWFTHAIPNFEYCKNELGTVKKVIEIGCFQGRSTCWMLENFLYECGEMACYDTFEGGMEHTQDQVKSMLDIFSSNVSQVKKETQIVNVHIGNSSKVMDFRFNDVDFAYIDGSHQAPDVLTDACMAFSLLKPNGIMLFDDYQWHENHEDRLMHPSLAIDAFVYIFQRRLETLKLPNPYQFAIRKL